MLHRTDRNETRGFTLMELAIVMGVVGSVLGAIWWAAGNAKELARQNSASTELHTVVQNLNDLMTGRSLTAAIRTNITANLIASQVIPSTYVNSAGNADNPWSVGNFKVWSADDQRSVHISFYNVSRTGCISLVLQGIACQAGQPACPVGVEVGGTPNTYSLGASAGGCTVGVTCLLGGNGWQATSVTNVTDMCSQNSYTGGRNSVEFGYAF